MPIIKVTDGPFAGGYIVDGAKTGIAALYDSEHYVVAAFGPNAMQTGLEQLKQYMEAYANEQKK